jgi:hypothetical protein
MEFPSKIYTHTLLLLNFRDVKERAQYLCGHQAMVDATQTLVIVMVTLTASLLYPYQVPRREGKYETSFNMKT